MNINGTPNFAKNDFEEFSQKIIKVAKYPIFSGKIKILITLLFLQLLKLKE